ncbi:hypothetical protein NFI96_007946 [Prochilodus magdalenae]|nr:hypothetical protein NFI96_007946 [Prochilodus magdalenae]
MEEDTNLVLKETDEVTLKCSYESTSGDIRLYWYRQRVHEAPEYLLYKGAKSLSSLKSTPTDPRLKAETTDTSTGLTISGLKLTDTALYYCALRCCTTMIISTVLLLSALTGLRAEDLITPNRDAVFTGEGQTVTLSCNYSGTANSLHWYRQYSGSPPQFLILDYSGTITEAQPPVPGILISHVKEQKTVDLKISSAAVSDSALYYCALQPTVTGNPDTLYRNWFYD